MSALKTAMTCARISNRVEQKGAGFGTHGAVVDVVEVDVVLEVDVVVLGGGVPAAAAEVMV
jgi:hypothetical protein